MILFKGWEVWVQRISLPTDPQTVSALSPAYLGLHVALRVRNIIWRVGVFILLCLTESSFLILACPPPPKVHNGRHTGRRVSPYLPGMIINYTCDPGYLLVGKGFIFCTHEGTWSQVYHYCKGTFYSCWVFMEDFCMRLIRLVEISSERMVKRVSIEETKSRTNSRKRGCTNILTSTK